MYQAIRSKFDNASQTAKHYGTRAMAAGGALLASGASFAAAPDVSAIQTEFDTYKVAVVGLVIAFAVVLWAIKAAGLLKPR